MKLMKAIETLLRGERTRVGNHSAVPTNVGSDYYYHSTPIAKVNDLERIVIINNGGWNTSSTSRAINNYISYFNSYGYSIIDERR